jgi:signal transduction histidine kinase
MLRIPRRLAVDGGVVALLAVATVAFGAWRFVTPDEGASFSRLLVEKTLPAAGGHAAWQLELARWWTATAVGMAAMLVRGRLPLVALAVTVAMSLVHVASLIVPFTAVDLAAPIALLTVAARLRSRLVSYAALAGTVACAVVPVVRGPSLLLGSWGGGSFTPPIAVALAWMIGDRSRAHSAYRVQVAQRTRDLERERDQQAALAAAAERARIARELHDAVAHGLSVIVIQAQAATGALERRPATAGAALASIVATGRASLTEMRRLLGMDRAEGPELAPLPGLADVPDLVERVRATGLPITLRLTGQADGLPTGIGLSVYRITQEALTNALKHAGPSATVDIDIRGGPEAVELCVADTGPGAGGTPDEGRGNGLRGMRERVAMLGGTLSAGDRPGGGFQVHAHLPLVERE